MVFGFSLLLLLLSLLLFDRYSFVPIGRGESVSTMRKPKTLDSMDRELVSSLANLDDQKMVYNEAALSLLVHSSLSPEERVSSADDTLFFEVEGLANKLLPLQELKGSDLSFKKFAFFCKFLGFLMEGYEREIVSLLRKLKAKKDRRVVTLSIKRRPSSMSCFDRELQKLECLINYSKSNRKERI